MTMHYVERHGPKGSVRLYGSPNYLQCVEFIVDYAKEKGDGAELRGRSTPDQWSIYYPTPGKTYRTVEILGIAKTRGGPRPR